ncbi:MAG: glutamate-5-semialdehyde dehydrogenase [Clostridiales bacterium]|nr:glutamate-5-semialdehyde dehydrogenase [Clostridiales bacterium]
MINFESVKKASRILALKTEEEKNNALVSISNALKENADEILIENQKDLTFAKDNGIKESMIARLKLSKEQIFAIAEDVLSVKNLSDPIGEVIDDYITKDGLNIKKVRVPLGVIGIIYESRPNVTVDVSVLCIKTGNAVVLKGGKEAKNTNIYLTKLIKKAIKNYIPEDSIMLLEDREETNELLKAKGNVDLIIPRGSKNLINFVTENSLVPVIETGAGVCHTYVEKTADFNMAIKIIDNAKTSKPSVCNALETLLIDRDIIKDFAPILEEFAAKKGVNIYANKETLKYIKANLIDDDAYNTEYNSMDLNVKVVDGISDAISHIEKYSTKHSEAIITSDNDKKEEFLNSIDSACVYANASTRFSDGGCFGFGAEIGISTQKLHARGPMGLKEITSYKYKITGNGEVR